MTSHGHNIPIMNPGMVTRRALDPDKRTILAMRTDHVTTRMNTVMAILDLQPQTTDTAIIAH